MVAGEETCDMVRREKQKRVKNLWDGSGELLECQAVLESGLRCAYL